MLTFADEMRALELAVAAEAARRAEALANSQRDAISLARRQGLLDAISQHGPLTARQCAEATGFSKDSTLHHLNTLIALEQIVRRNANGIRVFCLHPDQPTTN